MRPLHKSPRFIHYTPIHQGEAGIIEQQILSDNFKVRDKLPSIKHSNQMIGQDRQSKRIIKQFRN